jgi:hypothetical protein
MTALLISLYGILNQKISLQELVAETLSLSLISSMKSPLYKLIVTQLVKKSPSPLLWDIKVQYRIHKSLQVAPVTKQMNTVHVLNPIFKINFYIIIPSTPRSLEWSLTFRFSD